MLAKRGNLVPSILNVPILAVNHRNFPLLFLAGAFRKFTVSISPSIENTLRR